MTTPAIVAVIVVGYLIGALSFAVWIARRKGVDILREGSCNPGATNVKRVVGSTAGNLVFVLDALKGLVAAGWPLLVFADDRYSLAIIGLLAAIVGHSCSVFIGFRGGKGVATTMGGLAIIAPQALLGALIIWVLLYFTLRTVSLASIGFACALPVISLLVKYPGVITGFLAVLALLIIIRHHSNIRRLLKGGENRFN